jgi:hypothetical protein
MPEPDQRATRSRQSPPRGPQPRPERQRHMPNARRHIRRRIRRAPGGDARRPLRVNRIGGTHVLSKSDAAHDAKWARPCSRRCRDTCSCAESRSELTRVDPVTADLRPPGPQASKSAHFGPTIGPGVRELNSAAERSRGSRSAPEATRPDGPLRGSVRSRLSGARLVGVSRSADAPRQAVRRDPTAQRTARAPHSARKADRRRAGRGSDPIQRAT